MEKCDVSLSPLFIYLFIYLSIDEELCFISCRHSRCLFAFCWVVGWFLNSLLFYWKPVEVPQFTFASIVNMLFKKFILHAYKVVPLPIFSCKMLFFISLSHGPKISGPYTYIYCIRVKIAASCWQTIRSINSTASCDTFFSIQLTNSFRRK